MIRWMVANRSRLPGAVALAAGLFHVTPAHAQATNAALAETLFREGKQLMVEERYAEACPKIAESQRLDPGTGTLLNLAACHEAEGKLATAWAEFGEAASMSRRDNRADREQYATAHAKSLEPKIPRLALDIAPAAQALKDLEIKIDDVTVGRVAWSSPGPADPGVHVVTATATGKKPFRAEVTLPAEGSVTAVSIPALEDAPMAPAAVGPGPATTGMAGSPAEAEKPPGGNGKMVGLIVGGAGIAAIGVGSYFGLHAFSKWSERNDHCPKGQCDQTAVDASDAAHTSARIADVAMGVGIVAVGVGTYLFLTAPAASPETHGSRTWVGVGAVSAGAPGVTAGGVW